MQPPEVTRKGAGVVPSLMFIGHFAAAFAAKRITTRPSLGWLFVACQLPDLVWPIFVLAGVEQLTVDPGNTAFTPLSFDHYPWTHSLVMTAIWGALLGGVYLSLRRDVRGAVVIEALVMSHWFLDFVTHRPDLPLIPGNPARLGLGLWNSVPATLAVETLVFVGALWLYAMVTKPIDRIGRVGFWALIVFLLGTYLANAFGPPPPSPTIVAASALALWIIVPIAAWIDRHRRPAEVT
jgi:membrane-bound metal-dependent hydrolase YbcI (DUF457 family)